MVSKIKQIVPLNPWDSKYGKMYSFRVTFEDGVTIEANSKTETPPYGVGDEMNYEITNDDPKFGVKGRINKPDMGQGSTFSRPSGGSDRDAIIMKQTALKCASEFNAQRSVAVQVVIDDAQAMYDWLLGKGESPSAEEPQQDKAPF